MSTQHLMSSTFGTVNAQGRVVVPVEVRRALGITSGDRVEFLVADGEVRLVTPRMRAMALWAKNHGGDAGDSTRAVREHRTADQQAEAEAEQRIAARVDAETRNDDEIAAELFAGLGL
jgi:AbrB family looped-hinge helix DNA binding protein